MRFPKMAVPVVVAGVVAVGAAGVALAGTGHDGRVKPYIVGGEEATTTYSFIGSLQTDGHHMCGATLISSEWAVTAAHCVLDDNGKPETAPMRVRFGSNDRDSGGQLVSVSKIVPSPDPNQPGDPSAGPSRPGDPSAGPSRPGDPSAGPSQPGDPGDGGPLHDIALLKLAQAVSLAPAPIAAGSPQPGTKVLLLGWGQTCPKPGCEKDLPRRLKQLDTSVADPSKCGGIDAAAELCFATTSNGTDCYGDSGGPALVKTGTGLALVGATSRGAGKSDICGVEHSIYTDVTAFRDFINGQLGGSTPSPQPSQTGGPGQPGDPGADQPGEPGDAGPGEPGDG